MDSEGLSSSVGWRVSFNKPASLDSAGSAFLLLCCNLLFLSVEELVLRNSRLSSLVYNQDLLQGLSSNGTATLRVSLRVFIFSQC